MLLLLHDCSAGCITDTLSLPLYVCLWYLVRSLCWNFIKKLNNVWCTPVWLICASLLSMDNPVVVRDSREKISAVHHQLYMDLENIIANWRLTEGKVQRIGYHRNYLHFGLCDTVPSSVRSVQKTASPFRILDWPSILGNVSISSHCYLCGTIRYSVCVSTIDSQILNFSVMKVNIFYANSAS